MQIQDLYQLFLNATGITTDSRNIKDGAIFFALKGDRFDGNTFALQALEKGASYVVADDIKLKGQDRIILVEEVLKTLQELANFHRKQFKIPIVAITGSNGKTTTKELLSSILISHYRTHFTKGNFNNHIGVPLTLLDMPKDTEIAVIEMGANHIGEIAMLCEIVEPTHGVITNVGKAHLEGFGSFEGVKKAKSELYDFLAVNRGVAFVNLDEPFLEELAEEVKFKVGYNQSEDPNRNIPVLETKLKQINPTILIEFLSDHRDSIVQAKSHLFGQYNFNNIQTAVSIGRYFKVPSIKIKEAIENYIPNNNRSQLQKKDTNTFLLDAYNANPTSMRNALNNFRLMKAENKVVILGDMLELGAFSSEEHQSILNQAVSLSFDKVILVGKEFGATDTKRSEVFHFPDVEALKKWFFQSNISETLVLLKGSRGIGLEKLLS